MFLYFDIAQVKRELFEEVGGIDFVAVFRVNLKEVAVGSTIVNEATEPLTVLLQLAVSPHKDIVKGALEGPILEGVEGEAVSLYPITAKGVAVVPPRREEVDLTQSPPQRVDNDPNIFSHPNQLFPAVVVEVDFTGIGDLFVVIEQLLSLIEVAVDIGTVAATVTPPRRVEDKGGATGRL
jgi:hypothetical protein